MPAGPSTHRRRLRRWCSRWSVGTRTATILIVTTACANAPTSTVGTTFTVNVSAASTSIAQAVQPESPTSAADSEPVDIPITAGVDPALVNPPTAGPAATLVIDGDSFDQLSVTIPVGGVVTFVAADDAAHDIVVGTLSAVSVTRDRAQHYQFPLPGSFEVTDRLSAGTATIFVG